MKNNVVRTWSVLLATAMLGSACAGVRDREPNSEPMWSSATPVLAENFGKMLLLRARVATDSVNRDMDPVLLVEQVDGQAVPEGTSIWWSYGGWHADRPMQSGMHGLRLVPGCWYELRGYEAGSWRGIVDIEAPTSGASERLERSDDGFDDFGPRIPGGRGFGFRSVFRVTGGRLLRHGDLSGPDPYGLSPRK